jgi:putative ABC transport system ATP-binding protein
MDPILSVRDVSKSYSNGGGEVKAVNGVSLDLHTGEVILILGPSGSGKTTLLSIMGCLMRPTSGQVRIAGRETGCLSDRELSRLRCHEIGFVFQSFKLLGFLTVRRNVEIALNLAGIRGRAARQQAAALLHQVDLDHRLGFYPRDLSGGEKQRVSVARAVANKPTIVLADEPTGNLDSKAGRTVVDLLAGLARQQGSGVAIVTHDNRILDVADRVLYLSDGCLTS